MRSSVAVKPVCLRVLVGAFLILALAPTAAQAAAIAPTRFDDPPGAGSCPSNCSLRQAVTAAGAGGTVVLQAGAYKLTLGEIALSSAVTIAGPGAAAASISAGALSQLFTIPTGIRVTISGVTLTDGLAPASGSSGGSGGAISSNGILTLSSVTLFRNAAAGGTPTSKVFGGEGGEGGAVLNRGLVTIVGGAFVENTSHSGSSKFGLETTEFSGGRGSGGALSNDGTMILTGTSFSGNVAEGSPAGTVFGGQGGEGGALDNSGPARISGATFTGNVASQGSEAGGEGGAIRNDSSLKIAQSTLTSNVAGGGAGARGEGGAIQTLGAVTIDQSTLSANQAQGSSAEGGAIESFGVLVLTASTISGNASGGQGGGVDNFSSLEATNSTIASNAAATEGGGVENFGSTTLANATLLANTASAAKGGNVENFGSALLMHDTIIALGAVTGGAGGENCAGTANFISLGFNLEDRNQCGLNAAGDQVNLANPLLGPLGANGGPTQTVALLAGSPAIDAGDPAGCTDALGEPLNVDQRGVSRPQGPRCDIGAFELAQPPVPVATPLHPIVVSIPQLTGLRLSPSTFRAASSGPTIAAAKRSKPGTTISYNDSLAAVSSFAILRSTAGIRNGKRCVAPPRHRGKHRKFKRCTRSVLAGTFTHADRAGANKLHFSGRVHGKKLAPGSYTLTATPKLGTSVGRKTSVRFKIKR